MFYSLCYMKFKVIIVLILLLSIQNSNSENNLTDVDNIFHIGKMDSHNNNFVLFFKLNKKGIEKSRYHKATTIDVALIFSEFSFESPNGKTSLSIKILIQTININIPPI